MSVQQEYTTDFHVRLVLSLSKCECLLWFPFSYSSPSYWVYMYVGSWLQNINRLFIGD